MGSRTKLSPAILSAACLLIAWDSNARAQNPYYMWSYDSIPATRAVASSGSYLFVADGALGMVILSIDTSGVHFTGRYDPSLSVYSIAVKGDTVYLGAGSSEPYQGGLYIVDVVDKSNPYLLGAITSFQWEITAVTVDDHAYISDGNEIIVINISDPIHPTVLLQYSLPGIVQDIFERGSYLYVAADAAGLHVVDNSDPLNPVLVGTCDTPGWATAVTLRHDRDTHAYVADGDSGIQVIDIVNPQSPHIVGRCPTSGRAIDLIGGYFFVYAAIADSTMDMVEVADPAHPRIVRWGRTSGEVRGLCFTSWSEGFWGVAVACSDLIDVFRINSHGPAHMQGNFNGVPPVNGIDVRYGVLYLKGGAPPPQSCDCPPYANYCIACDVNGNCRVDGMDVSVLVGYLQGRIAEFKICPDCPFGR